MGCRAHGADQPRTARTGGLGSADRHDVHAPATVTLRVAMQAAAHRDSIARQYANGFQDVFAVGLPPFQAMLAAGHRAEWAMLAAFLALLGELPDTHLQRKFGDVVAAFARSMLSSLNCRPPRQRIWPYPAPA